VVVALVEFLASGGTEGNDLEETTIGLDDLDSSGELVFVPESELLLFDLEGFIVIELE